MTAWHQDNLYFPLDTDQVVTLWVALVDITSDMGSLMFGSGSHMGGFVGYEPISDHGESYFERLLDDHRYSITANGSLSAGDISCHHGWTIHRAPSNSSDRCREAAVVVYYPDGTRLRAPANPYQQRALDLAFRGGAPGELAAGPLNPVVYRRAS